ncbi:zinc finger CW-type PWWP domain protein 2 isoform X1 [Eubalaena glacialis]|uniref:zinc finger CW-type PWWP domain protein 2 isoform X1 n=2 Tax=Eubalaena glacialis TaxID=27606 RepID=UPI002A59A5C6|nr:zinc finger CW-type PWWP domain protein 2 isoform X1 [Eubalaena glacialis]
MGGRSPSQCWGRVGERLNAFMEKGKLNSKMIAEYCNTALDSSVENSMYVNKVWVQCENESCLKWRLLSSEDAAKVDHNEPWYCFMNTDLRYNKCSVSEEDFPEESQLHQSGFKIVYSQLPLGSLVLVKLQTWPSWPGILCPDPFKGKYVTYDLDGDVEQYHIEFLGDPHSRSWINATFVGHYSITLKPGKCKNKKKWYKSALQEAYLLYGYSHEQRLERCCLSKQDKSKADGKVAVVAKKRMQVSKNNTKKKKPKFRKRKRKTVLKSSFENVCSDDALSKENMVVSETELLLKELEQMLEQALEPTAAPDESEGERGEETDTGEKLSKCGPEAPVGSSLENHCEEDYLVIDGLRLKAGECIESITNKFKEIDALMSAF